MTQLRFIDPPDPRLQTISTRRIMAYGRAWLEALKLDSDSVLRRWPNTDCLVIEDPLAGDELLNPVTTGAALVELVASVSTVGELGAARRPHQDARDSRLIADQDADR